MDNNPIKFTDVKGLSKDNGDGTATVDTKGESASSVWEKHGKGKISWDRFVELNKVDVKTGTKDGKTVKIGTTFVIKDPKKQAKEQKKASNSNEKTSSNNQTSGDNKTGSNQSGNSTNTQKTEDNSNKKADENKQSNTATTTYESGKEYKLDVVYKEPAAIGIGDFGVSYSWVTISDGKEKIESAGMSGSGGLAAAEVSLFHWGKADEIYFHQTMSGNNLLDVFNETSSIKIVTAGTIIMYNYVIGYDSKGNKLWTAHLKGTAIGASVSVSKGSATFEKVE